MMPSSQMSHETHEAWARRRIAELGVLDRKKEERADIERLAREFWERVVTSAGQECVNAHTVSYSTCIALADYATAEWRKRFDPREKDAAR